ncbi:DUF3939 domain-containing protein [Paenibacillus donghaensis]|uniref:DUF3939 domain-containing protein n=1 Tax=Paenibacillus donghaensis TaxID=414771 RepID=A0A2Z2KI25_9BACL|nr:DUF3939 domain-containing protein [Paenibacillus donghaensis]ASA22933.1 hypothetical protein B9T62_20250 [Paenibacillus donghaensis]
MKTPVSLRTFPGSRVLLVLFLAAMLSGCMYPGPESRKTPGKAYRESINRVQAAVEAYQEEEGVLPILNASQDTPRYEKFLVDVVKLQQQGYLESIPAVAFEQGGSAYFLLLDEETSPVVKLMDLVTVQTVNDVQRQVDRYTNAHGGTPPTAEPLYPGLFSIDTAKLSGGSVKLISVYSGEPLELMMDSEGKVFADYAPDLMQLLEQQEPAASADQDLRPLLEQASYFVPVKSLPYLWMDGQPVPQP